MITPSSKQRRNFDALTNEKTLGELFLHLWRALIELDGSFFRQALPDAIRMAFFIVVIKALAGLAAHARLVFHNPAHQLTGGRCVEVAALRGGRLASDFQECVQADTVTDFQRPHRHAGLATDIILKSRERATISLSSDSGVDDVMALVRQLSDHGRLTSSIILRALCMGDITFFECAMAHLSGVTLDNARRLIHDRGPLGLRAVFDKAKLPPAQFVAVRAALDVSRETQMDGGDNDRERYARRMIERIMTQYDDLGVEFESSDLEYLLTKMDELPSDVLGDDGTTPAAD